jgi:Flp pilus assembly pilin Flp
MQYPAWMTARRRRGATAMEYLFMASLILIAAITAIGYFGESTKGSLEKSGNSINKATTGK